MDTKQLITIVVTAVITAAARTLIDAVTKFVKAVITRLARMLKRSVTPVLERLGKDTDAVFSLFMLGYLGSALFRAVRSVEPLSRSDVFFISALTVMCFYWFVMTARAFGRALKKETPNQTAQTTPGLRPSVSDL